MRNAVIRKKHLKYERAMRGFMMRPQRIVLGVNMPTESVLDIDALKWQSRLMAI